MEGLGIAANVIAVVDLSVKVTALCVNYCKGVKKAKDDIVRLQLEVVGLQSAANSVQELLEGPSGGRLKTSQQLSNAVCHSQSELRAVYQRLRPTSAREAFTRLGFRTLRWPLHSKEVEQIVQNIVRYTQAINLALQVDQTNILFDVDRRAVLDRLEIEVANGASFDSRAEEHHPTCLPKTRVDLLQQVLMWAHDPSSEAIFWLNGMAGTGKSTIARTVAHDLARSHDLGASFFFKRGETDRDSLSKVFPTMAADLVHNIPMIAPHVKDAIETDPSILRKTAREQFEKLVRQPLSMISAEPRTPSPITIVIDALDECESEDDIKLMFRLLSRAGTGQLVRLKIFLTSRPELPIRLGFKEMQGRYQDLMLHEISQHVITHDITTFLNEELAKIRREYNLTVRKERQLPDEWPGASDSIALVHMAIPLFIFAATVCRFIGDRRLGSPDKQLSKVLLRAGGDSSQLATTYLPVLENMIDKTSDRLREESVQAFRNIVGSIVTLASPLSVSALAQILNISERDIEVKLDMLHAVLSVPETTDAPVRLLHLSFRDFLVDPGQRAENPFWDEGPKQLSEFLDDAMRFVQAHSLAIDGTPLQVYSSLLVFSPERSRVRTTFLSDIPGWISPQPKVYSDWSQCLQTLEGHGGIVTSVAFSHDSGLVASGSDDKTIRVWRTATGQHIQTLEGHGLQVMSVAFSHDSALVVSGSADKTIRVWRTATGEHIHTLEGHNDRVISVAVSHDSALVASGSADKTIRVWRTATGEYIQTLKGHGGIVTSVAFSHDSGLVASGSADRTIRVWRTAMDDCIQLLEGHDNWVGSVAFSHDSTLVVSGSHDRTIRVWRIATGECIQTLEDHNLQITSVAFSHDSALVASGSADKTIRVWRTTTGECIQMLEGHDLFVTSVAFSHDSALVASGSADKTIRVWTTAMSKCAQTLVGYGGFVESVAFSHDSALIVSGSHDKTVRLWRASTGGCVQTMEGHDNWVISVAFSHDSALIVSCSHDKTIRLWRTATGKCVQTMEGHDHWVESVAFSCDSALIVSGSHDKTVRIWRTATGECVQTMPGHDNWVRSVAFSYDSALVASGSGDKTIRLWRSATGECIQTFEGHSRSVMSVALSYDRTLVASGSADKTIRGWFQTGHRLRPALHPKATPF
ncbi:WD40 repeat-like protein [Purpureocillium lilacinum]|uniref:WD40 repeat-like protein n=1 Tax=Purpureocillium lilacinum TaxID=33203 RepID=A0A179G9C3_PURLI|nr:WD40 repeat-like protein [Purpureocillium lilacinum]OAQ74416.1 WD40 repeat-like protein [Purpureocillium lilacinum]